MSRVGAASAAAPVVVEHVRVRSDRIEATVRVAGVRYRDTDAPLIERCLKRAPSLAMHACRNPEGLLFSAVMDHTSVPHLLEHLIVDAETRSARDAARVFTGTTQWSAHDVDEALVSVSFEDDLLALRALDAALAGLNEDLVALRGAPTCPQDVVRERTLP